MATDGSLELGREPIGKLLWKYSLPAIIAMSAMSLYNIIDRIFLGQGVSPMAISGLAISVPLMNLSIAFSTLVGVGGSTLVSIRLGEKAKKEANFLLGNVVLLSLILGISYSVSALLFLDPLLRLFGASNITLPYARDFMQVILAGNVVSYAYFGLNHILRSSGNPRKAMTTTLITIGCNLIFAPIFIFVFHWGIRGAAFATVLSQCGGLTFLIHHFRSKKNTVRFKPSAFHLRWYLVKSIFSIGSSPFLINLCVCTVAIFLNLQFTRYGGDIAIGAYGITNGVVSLFVMIILGLTQGMQPIVGYNYGADQMRRVLRTLKYAIFAGVVIASSGVVVGELFPYQISRAFTSDENMIDAAAHGMRIMLLLFSTAGFQIVTSNFFQAIGKVKVSIFLSLSRQLIFLVPAVLILPRFLNTDGAWASYPVADFISFAVTFFVLRHNIHKMRNETAISHHNTAAANSEHLRKNSKIKKIT